MTISETGSAAAWRREADEARKRAGEAEERAARAEMALAPLRVRANWRTADWLRAALRLYVEQGSPIDVTLGECPARDLHEILAALGAPPGEREAALDRDSARRERDEARDAHERERADRQRYERAWQEADALLLRHSQVHSGWVARAETAERERDELDRALRALMADVEARLAADDAPPPPRRCGCESDRDDPGPCITGCKRAAAADRALAAIEADGFSPGGAPFTRVGDEDDGAPA